MAIPIYGVKDDEVKGLITFADIVSFIRSLCPNQEVFEESLKTLTLGEENLGELRVDRLLGSFSTGYWPVFMRQPISTLVTTFKKGYPFLPVADEDEMLVNMVSASLLVRILAFELSKLQPAISHKEETLQSLGYVKGFDSVPTISLHQRALDALMMMCEVWQKR